MEPFYIIQNFTQLSLCMRVMIMTSFFIFLTFKPAIPNFFETYLEYKTDNIITNLFTHAEVKEQQCYSLRVMLPCLPTLVSPSSSLVAKCSIS